MPLVFGAGALGEVDGADAVGHHAAVAVAVAAVAVVVVAVAVAVVALPGRLRVQPWAVSHART